MEKEKLSAVALFAAFAVLAAGLASPRAKADNRVGAELGFNIASANTAPDPTSPTTTQGTHLGFGGGLYSDIGLTSFLYFFPEVLYLQKGASIGPVTYNLNYFDVPLLIKGKLDLGQFKPFLFTGPEFGFNLDSTASSGPVSVGATNFNMLDFAWDFGGGLEYAVTPLVSVEANIRYSLGAIDDDSSMARWYSRGILFMFGASIPF